MFFKFEKILFHLWNIWWLITCVCIVEVFGNRSYSVLLEFVFISMWMTFLRWKKFKLFTNPSWSFWSLINMTWRISIHNLRFFFSIFNYFQIQIAHHWKWPLTRYWWSRLSPTSKVWLWYTNWAMDCVMRQGTLRSLATSWLYSRCVTQFFSSVWMTSQLHRRQKLQ